MSVDRDSVLQESERYLVRFPWEPDDPFFVKLLRRGEKVSRVRTIDPEPGCYAGAWAARTEWLEETP